MVLLVLLFVLIIYPFLNISVKSYEIIKEKLPASFNNYKILQISDLYLKGTEKLSKLEGLINNANPNLVVFTGNTFINQDEAYYENFVEMKNNISQSLIFYVSIGETELELDQAYKKTLFDKFRDEGIYLLDDKKVELNKGGQTITIEGVLPEKSSYDKKADKLAISEKLSINEDKFNLVLSHNPVYADDLGEKGADLVLSGSRNGGWIRLPGIGGIDYGSDNKYKEDYYILPKKGVLIVSKGAGTLNGKIRLFNQREVSEITLKR